MKDRWRKLTLMHDGTPRVARRWSSPWYSVKFVAGKVCKVCQGKRASPGLLIFGYSDDVLFESPGLVAGLRDDGAPSQSPIKTPGDDAGTLGGREALRLRTSGALHPTNPVTHRCVTKTALCRRQPLKNGTIGRNLLPRYTHLRRCGRAEYGGVGSCSARHTVSLP